MKVFRAGTKKPLGQYVMLIACLGSAPLFLAGCFGIGKTQGVGVQIVMPAVVSQYFGPRARITLADFEVKAVHATGEAGAQLRNMIEQSLNSTNRYVLVERGESLNGAGSGQASSAVSSADIIITAAVVKFEPQVSGGSGGIGGGGGESRGALGGLLGSGSNRAHLALEIRVADAASSKVLNTFVVQSQATDVSGLGPADSSLRGGLSAYSRTPMEKAIRICVAESARRISEAIPAAYYKE